MDNKLVILCNARSGSRYLSKGISDITNKAIAKTHNPNYVPPKDVSVIGIIRNPLDTIVSNIAMAKYLNGHSPDISQNEIKLQSDRYIAMCDAIGKRSDLVVDFASITGKLKKLSSHIVDLFGLERIPASMIDQKQSQIVDIDGARGYLVSSKTSNDYDSIRSEVVKFDLSNAESAYQKLLLKAIDI